MDQKILLLFPHNTTLVTPSPDFGPKVQPRRYKIFKWESGIVWQERKLSGPGVTRIPPGFAFWV